MDISFDSENYWHRSTSKAFSFDDDEDDGNVASDLNAQRKWHKLSCGAGNKSILNDDDISEASFDSSALGSALNLSIKSIVSEDVMQVILKEQTLEDRETFLTKGVMPDEELRLLRRQIQTLLYHPSAETTTYKLLLGKHVHMEMFKSLHEKEQLLDSVLDYGGGDALIGVLLFLKRTLNRKNFHQILQVRHKALQHYLSFLQQSHRLNEACELLQLSGMTQQAALLKFNAAITSNDFTTRKTKLRQLVDNYNVEAATTITPLYQEMFIAALKLVELKESQQQALDNRIDLNSTSIEVLYACCSKHNNCKDQVITLITSPYRLCAEQQISTAQFEWTALHERAAVQAYGDLEAVFERVPSWNPMKHKQFHISFSLETAI